MIIRPLHKCDAEHVGSEPVKEVFRGETVWEGDVEVFNVTGHPKAKRAYAWSVDENTPQERFTAVLEIPPVQSALDAVKVSIVADAKRGQMTLIAAIPFTQYEHDMYERLGSASGLTVLVVLVTAGAIVFYLFRRRK
jgi:hypothetical protein